VLEDKHSKEYLATSSLRIHRKRRENIPSRHLRKTRSRIQGFWNRPFTAKNSCQIFYV